jgi:transcriptional regulator with XRE-family HTH domain
MTNQFRLDVGQRIRKLREDAGYSNQRDFAKLVGVGASDLSRIERGLRKLDTVLLRRIATQLNVSMDAFFPESRAAVALTRRGDADAASMERMVNWAENLRADLDRVSGYVAGSRD